MTVDELSTTFAALADPTRRALLERLAQGDATVNELAAPHDMSLQAVSRHLQILEHAGLVSKRRDGRRRPCHAELDAIEPAIGWLDTQHQCWSDRLDRLGDHLRDLQRTRSHSPNSTHPEREES